MRTISDVFHNKGGTTEYTCKDGKVLKVQYLTLKNMSEYENKLQNRTLKTLTEQRNAIPEDIFKELFGEILDKIASGGYAFGGELCTASLNTITGIADLFSILCSITPDEAMHVISEEGDALKMLFDEVIRKSVGSKDDEDAINIEKKSPTSHTGPN